MLKGDNRTMNDPVIVLRESHKWRWTLPTQVVFIQLMPQTIIEKNTLLY